jgi:hypothetical protein
MFEFIKFEIWMFRMTLDGETTKIKVVDPKRLYNFVADNFLIWNHLVKENYIWIFKNLKFEFLNTLDGQTAKTKVIDLKKIWNFIVDNFFIWNHLVKQSYIWISQI